MSRPRSGAEAARRAAELYPRSRGFRGAYLRGWHSGRAGRPVEACPYRRGHGWASVWAQAWLRGWSAGSRAR